MRGWMAAVRDAGNGVAQNRTRRISLKLAWRQFAALGFPPPAGVSHSRRQPQPIHPPHSRFSLVLQPTHSRAAPVGRQHTRANRGTGSRLPTGAAVRLPSIGEARGYAPSRRPRPSAFRNPPRLSTHHPSPPPLQPPSKSTTATAATHPRANHNSTVAQPLSNHSATPTQPPANPNSTTMLAHVRVHTRDCHSRQRQHQPNHHTAAFQPRTNPPTSAASNSSKGH